MAQFSQFHRGQISQRSSVVIARGSRPLAASLSLSLSFLGRFLTEFSAGGWAYSAVWMVKGRNFCSNIREATLHDVSGILYEASYKFMTGWPNRFAVEPFPVSFRDDGRERVSVFAGFNTTCSRSRSRLPTHRSSAPLGHLFVENPRHP